MSVIKTFRTGFAEIVGLKIHYMGMLLIKLFGGINGGIFMNRKYLSLIIND